MINRYFFYYPVEGGNDHLVAKTENGVGYVYDDTTREWIENPNAIKWALHNPRQCDFRKDESELMMYHGMA